MLLIMTIAGLGSSAVSAKDADYDAVVNHLKLHYSAKRQRIPFLGLARFAVGVVRPAGVKSFDVAVFQKLKFDGPDTRISLNQTLGQVLGENWQPIVRSRSNKNEEYLVYACEAGNNIRLLIVCLAADQATVVRAKINTDKLVEFLRNPKIMGVAMS
jgi:hypothetical protein